ncbi:hypothetical protein CRG98_047735 [Punica granatum]|uniref:Leucine-rich repeat-containing N-terminal plant-type domain-containing protein n=1 Tax=Punica granatum TaxID=22663 RepID=A0A2I0HJJ9_PUNGR|nr:hypothetical protein CRG98_047735 [Punica granatum]
MGHHNLVPKHFVNQYYAKETRESVYTPYINLVRGEDLWDKSGHEAILPPKYCRGGGRPKKKRTKNNDVLANPFKAKRGGEQKCGNCDDKGHNSRRALNSFHEQLDYPIDGWDGPASEGCNRTGVICENSTDIPPWVVGLFLGNRRLGGGVDDSLTDLDNLRVRNLSSNHLRGFLPSFNISNFFFGPLESTLCHNASYIETLDLSVGIPGRSFSKYNRVWNLPPTLDLSSNKLSGPILAGLGNLRGLHALKLNNNSFSGNIPETLSGMEILELLDLSQNNLSGQIPLTLIEINFLSHFNVSFNTLSGEVPSGGQFQTFSSPCFVGNSDLCGLPLPPCQSEFDHSNRKHFEEPPAGGRIVMARA